MHEACVVCVSIHMLQYEACVVCVSIHYAEQCFRYGACMRHVWCVSPFIMLNSASGMVHVLHSLCCASGMVHV